MKIPFTKMQGIGNDFVVFNFVENPIELSNEQFAQIADRRYGVGCDQILIVSASDDSQADFCYRIVNADGSEVGQCGNGARCLVKFIQQQKLSDKEVVTVKTQNSLMQLRINDDDSVTVNMGKVSFAPEAIPFLVDQNQDQETYLVDVGSSEGSTSVNLTVANIGNPHCMLLADDIDRAAVETLGAALESHPRFPEKVNVSFLQMLSPNEVNLRVYERGAGETLACGSAACASVAMGHRLGLLERNVTVHLPGGDLLIELSDADNVIMTGPAEFCFTGEVEI
jgi:diaminopimelate epimerase